MTEKPVLDPEAHEDDTVMSVWKRRTILILLIILVVAVAAPTFGGCSNFLSTKKTVATFEIAGQTHDVTDEDLNQFMVRYNTLERLFSDPRDPRGARGLPEGEEGVKQALEMIMLDAAAKADGVRVPDSVVTSIIEQVPQFQVAGKYDDATARRVLSEVGSRNGFDLGALAEILRTELRSGEYVQSCVMPLDLVPGEDAYDSWKKRNVKLTVDYVASPFEAQRGKFANAQPSEDDKTWKDIATVPAVRQILAVPPAKTVEIAYLKVEDMTPERFAAAKKFAEDAEIFSEDQPLSSAAFVLFHDEKDTVFTKERWVQATDPGYPERKRAAEEKHAAWEKLSKEDREKQPEPALEKDPAADYPEDVRAQILKWQDRVEKEVVARGIVAHLGQAAERTGKSLEEVGAEYARFGVKVVKNPEPLPDDQIVEKFPDPVARDSEFDQVVRSFKPPPEGGVFKPQYHSIPVPTTRLAERLADRGFMVMRLASCDPARSYKVDEKRDAVVEVWRKRSVALAAKAVLEEIEKKVEAAGPEVEKRTAALRTAAAEAGLTVQTLRRFNARTEAPKPPAAAAGQTLSPEVEAVARRIALRNYVQQGYAQMATKEPGAFVDPHWVDDDKMQAAMLILLVEKHEPAPVEMQDADLAMERTGMMRQAEQKKEAVFGYDALAKRFNLQRFEEKPKKPG